MTNEDGQIAIVVNGEIYNHAELRADLVAKGHRFRSGSDSEVVAHLYEEVGARVPELLRGMFAFALWDAPPVDAAAGARSLRRKAALLRRAAGRLRVRLRARRACSPTSGPRPPSRCRRWTPIWRCSTSPAPTPSTRGSRSSPPGTRWSSAAASGRWCVATIAPASRRRWPSSTSEEAAARVRATVEKAVQDRLMSDVPLGAFLSGGVDSSIVVACMARATGSPVKTFSIGFSEGGREDNELPFARLVAERYRTDHHELIVAPDMTGLLPSIVRHHGEPFADSSAVPTYYLCQLARRHVTVALSGRRGRRVVRRLPALRLGARGRPSPAASRVRFPALAARRAGGGAGRAGALAARVRRAPRRPTRRRGTCASSVTSPPARRRDIYTPELRERFARDATAEAFAAQARPPAPPATSSAACRISTATPTFPTTSWPRSTSPA